MKTILATTYAVNPFKGSEDGMGWNFIFQIARFNKVIAITRENNKADIEKYIAENPTPLYDNIQFIYFDLPKWQRFWKKGSRGALVYYYLWQLALPRFIRKQKILFDVVHNLNFHNDWTPSFLWKLKKPFVWGPVGHHPLIPNNYLQNYNSSYWIKDRFLFIVKKIFWNFSFSLKRTTKRANHIICMNSTVKDVLHLENNYSIIPSVASENFRLDRKRGKAKFSMLSVGRLVPLKGFDMTIESFQLFLAQVPVEEKSNCELVIVGNGPELETYKEMVQKLNIVENVIFHEWMDRVELMELYKDASVFVFPSHEGAGMVVSEALSFGLPVICLDNCGPGEFINEKCGFKVNYKHYQTSIEEIKNNLIEMYRNPQLLKLMGINARALFEEKFQWDVRGIQLKKIYANL